MKKIDYRHPNGIDCPAIIQNTPPSPVVSRQMTAEERKQYGFPQPHSDREVSRISKDYHNYLDSKLGNHYKDFDLPESVKRHSRRYSQV